jgi:hypothetical protein
VNERPITYPELVLKGPMRDTIAALRGKIDPDDAHVMAARAVILRESVGQNWDPIDTYLYWALHRWDRAGSPVFAVDGDLALGLVNTDLPSSTFYLPPEVPVDGMYVVMPPVFDIGSDGQGMYRIEGFFLTVSDIYVPVDGQPVPSSVLVGVNQDAYRVVRGVTVVGIGEDRAPELARRLDRGEGWKRDDLVVFFNLVPGMPIQVGASVTGSDALARVVVNLLYALQKTGDIREVADPPRQEFKGADRKSRRERDRQHWRGRSVLAHRTWKASPVRGRTIPDPDAPVVPALVPTVDGDTVRGHFRQHWVSDPGDRPVLTTREVSTRDGGTRTYHLVTQWLPPYERGSAASGDPAR